MTDHHGAVIFLTHFEKLLNDLIKLMDELDPLDPTERLPRECEERFVRLATVTHVFCLVPLDMLNLGVWSSPPLRHWYYRNTRTPIRDVNDMRQKPTFTGNLSTAEGRVHTLFDLIIIKDPSVQDPFVGVHGIESLVGEIFYNMEKDPEVAALITPYVADHCSILALVAELRHQLMTSYPWSIAWRCYDLEGRHLTEDKMTERPQEIKKAEEVSMPWKIIDGWQRIVHLYCRYFLTKRIRQRRFPFPFTSVGTGRTLRRCAKRKVGLTFGGQC